MPPRVIITDTITIGRSRLTGRIEDWGNEESMKFRNALLAVFGCVLLAGMATPAEAQYHHHHHRHHHHHHYHH